MKKKSNTLLEFSPREFDPIERVRTRVRGLICEVIEEELDAALGASSGERCEGRRGYRNGHMERRLLTEHGPMELTLPRARMFGQAGECEWHSQIAPRYARRTKRIDEAILGCYLSGANTRKIRKALAPLFGEELLSKSTISRIVGKIKQQFEEWGRRDLAGERCAYLFLDAIRMSVRLARRVVKVPVLACVGVREDGTKVLLALRIAGSESLGSWGSVVEDLKSRGLADPLLVVCDGNAGLIGSIRNIWPKADVQRCLKHKLENLLAHAPKHAHAELRRDFREIHFGKTSGEVRAAYENFRRKWKALCPPVAKSLEEAGEDLLTFTKYPKSQWSVLRTSNHIERLNLELRRRTKTQGSFPTEQAALTLLWGLVAFGQVEMRRIRGYKDMPQVTSETLSHAA